MANCVKNYHDWMAARLVSSTGCFLGLMLACGCGHQSAGSPAAKTAPAGASIAGQAAGAMPPSQAPVEITAATSPAVAAGSEVSSVAAVSRPEQPAVATSAATRITPGAPEPTPPPGQRPPADRGPTRPGETEKITFDDLILGMQADMVFRPFLLTERVKQLDGKRVTIMGYIHPGATGKGIKQFVLLRNSQCKFGAGGQADHLAQVFMRKGSGVDYRLEAVKVEGTLKIEPTEGPDGNTWSIYRLEDAIAR